MLSLRNDVYNLLARLGASPRLIRHLQLVGEAADLLVERYHSLGLAFDEKLTELGIAVHHAGKITYPEELNRPGSKREWAGEQLMLDHSVQPDIARCCVTHTTWTGEKRSLEERTVAFPDKLRKGRRESGLELLVIDDVAQRLGVARWGVFEVLDSTFEDIASGASDRLARSRG